MGIETKWTVDAAPLEGHRNIVREDGFVIASLSYDYRFTCNAETWVNAHLMAAAPDLCAALAFAIDCLDHDGNASAAAVLNVQGRAALSKARRNP